MSNGYEYIDNDNIPRDMLYKAGLNLLDKEKYLLSKNFIENLNYFSKRHVPITQRYAWKL